MSIQRFIDNNYNIAWQSDPVQAGESPSLYILTECHENQAARKCNAQFVNQFAQAETSRLLIEGEISGQRVLNSKESEMSQGVNVPVQILGWDLDPLPEEQFTKQEVGLYKRATIAARHLPVLDSLPRWQAESVLEILAEPELRVLQERRLKYAMSPPRFYARNLSMLQTIERLDQGAAKAGQIDFLMTGAGHVIDTLPDQEAAVALVRDQLKDKKVVILEPKSAISDQEFLIARSQLVKARQNLVGWLLPYWHGFLTHHMYPQLIDFLGTEREQVGCLIPRYCQAFDCYSDILRATDGFEEALGLARQEQLSSTLFMAVPAKELARPEQPMSDQELVLELGRRWPSPSSAKLCSMFMKHCFDTTGLAPELQATCIQAVRSIYADQLKQFISLVLEQGESGEELDYETQVAQVDLLKQHIGETHLKIREAMLLYARVGS